MLFKQSEIERIVTAFLRYGNININHYLPVRLTQLCCFFPINVYVYFLSLNWLSLSMSLSQSLLLFLSLCPTLFQTLVLSGSLLSFYHSLTFYSVLFLVFFPSSSVSILPSSFLFLAFHLFQGFFLFLLFFPFLHSMPTL